MPRLTPQDLLELTPDLIAELTRDNLEKTTLLVVGKAGVVKASALSTSHKPRGSPTSP